MGTRTRPTTARSPFRLVRLAAAAVTGLAASPAAAGAPLDPTQLETPPRTPTVQSSYQTWIGFTAVGPIRDPVLMSVDLVGGFQPDMHPAAVVVRPAIGLALPHGLSTFAGYSYASFWDDKHRRGEEHTLFQQVAYQAPLAPVLLFSRLRVEERLRAGSDVGVRLRALVQVTVPLWHRAPLEAVLSDEVFLGLNQPADWQPSLMDQDMFFAGIGWMPDAHFRAEVGYLGVLAPRPVETALVHCLSISTAALW